ncbi:endonuclease I family [Trichomonas vaginalis G3]|nr:endonuclease I family [Trichomonas vaginalis G3]KAI5532136.1 endonuclease I family [Trichomonas vaginalis G3]
MVYGSSTFPWKCGQRAIPSDKYVNAEHTVPQSFFNSKTPMVSDLHHLFSAPKTLNGARSNYKFDEFPYSECIKFCKDNECQTTAPSNPDQYSCLHKSKKKWMPVKKDRGQVVRAIFYFFTVYGEKYCKLSDLGDLSTLKSWNQNYPPSDFEILRNNIVNQTQGNINPYIDDYSLVNQAF